MVEEHRVERSWIAWQLTCVLFRRSRSQEPHAGHADDLLIGIGEQDTNIMSGGLTSLYDLVKGGGLLGWHSSIAPDYTTAYRQDKGKQRCYLS